jgi:uncharacterized protein YcaQ
MNIEVSADQVVRLWFERQGLTQPRGTRRLDKRALRQHLEKTGALQMDSINVIDRAHYLTLWSRFGPYPRKRLDDWVYRDRVAYEYWGHEASLLPISHLPLGRRRMRRFPPPSWSGTSWWERFKTSPASKRRVLKRLRAEGPLESIDFEADPAEFGPAGSPGGTMPLAKEDKRSLKLLWHAGRVAIRGRRHFRCVYDLAERVYPEGPVGSGVDFEDSWLLTGLSGNGIASERHLTNYFTAPTLKAPARRRVIQRNLKKGKVVEVRVQGRRNMYYALPEQLDTLEEIPAPEGTNLICPFDSLLWQRERAEELLGFRYRVEIYLPAAKRQYGYYVLPILHDGRFVGRLDPKLHRDRGVLEIRSIHLEPGFKRARRFDLALADAMHSLREFVSADALDLPKGWRGLG